MQQLFRASNDELVVQSDFYFKSTKTSVYLMTLDSANSDFVKIKKNNKRFIVYFFSIQK